MEALHRKLRLHQLVSLIKSLYPNQRTTNPYKQETKKISTYLNLEDQLLFTDLLHCLTVLNNNNNHQPGFPALTSTQPDFVNALHLILPKELQLTPKVMDAHQKLRTIYDNKLFNYNEAGSRLHISAKSVQRYLKPLELHGLAKKYSHPSKRTLIEVLPIPTTEPQPDMFETMQGEWKDFVGFVEF